MSRMPAASPAQSRPAAMPSLSQGFDDLNGRYFDSPSYPPVQSQRGPDYTLGSNSVSHYPELPTPYHPQPSPSQHFEPYQSNGTLPSIKDVHGRRERIGGGIESNGNVATPSYDSLGHLPSTTPVSEHGSYMSRRSSFYDQNPRSHPSYPTYGSGQVTPTADFSRYGQSAYEPSTRAYPTMYGDVEYSAHTSNGSQQPNFGVMGDSSDPRSKRRRGNLPKHVTDLLRAWFHEHLDHPYPTEEDKQMFIARTGLSISQVGHQCQR
jgi:Homeobox KN domain